MGKLIIKDKKVYQKKKLKEWQDFLNHSYSSGDVFFLAARKVAHYALDIKKRF